MIRKFSFKFIITLLLVVLVFGSLMPMITFAASKEFLDPNQFDDSSANLITDAKIGESSTFGDILYKAGGVILNLARVVALSWAVLMLISIAIKYMTANAQIKAQLKTDIPTYIIGAVILFGASGILTLIKYFIDDYVA